MLGAKNRSADSHKSAGADEPDVSAEFAVISGVEFRCVALPVVLMSCANESGRYAPIGL